jgi:Transposase IS116/IS110/IS902 family
VAHPLWVGTFSCSVAGTASPRGVARSPARGAQVQAGTIAGLGEVLGARVLGEFGDDDPNRHAGARAPKNYAGTSPITRASGKEKDCAACYVRNDRLGDVLHQQAFCLCMPLLADSGLAQEQR